MPNSHLITLIDAYDEAELVETGRRVAGSPEVFPIGANLSFVLPLSQDEVFVHTCAVTAGPWPSGRRVTPQPCRPVGRGTPIKAVRTCPVDQVTGTRRHPEQRRLSAITQRDSPGPGTSRSPAAPTGTPPCGGSADLTERALSDNIELGVVLRDPYVVEPLVYHFPWLPAPENKVMRPACRLAGGMPDRWSRGPGARGHPALASLGVTSGRPRPSSSPGSSAGSSPRSPGPSSGSASR